MAQRRAGAFPVTGDRVLAEDGSVWIATEADGGVLWAQQDPALSVDELDAVAQEEAAVLRRLSEDHRVYALAFSGVRVVKREEALNESDPMEAFVLALASSSLRDSIVAVVSEDRKRSDLEARTATRLRAFLGDPEWGTVQSKLAALRVQIADEDAPEGVAAKAREPLNHLAELAGKLPQESDARKTITALASAKRADPTLPDKLFRELIVMGVDVETATHAQGAATQVVRAYG